MQTSNELKDKLNKIIESKTFKFLKVVFWVVYFLGVLIIVEESINCSVPPISLDFVIADSTTHCIGESWMFDVISKMDANKSYKEVSPIINDFVEKFLIFSKFLLVIITIKIILRLFLTKNIKSIPLAWWVFIVVCVFYFIKTIWVWATFLN